MKTRILYPPVHPYQSCQLAALYRVSKKTFNRNIKGIKDKLGKRTGYFWNIKQVEIIFKHLDWPYIIEEYKD